MSKLYIFFSFFILTLVSFSQTNLNTTGLAGNPSKAISLFSGLKVNDYGHNRSENNSNVEGSPYLFKNWNNKSKIWYDDKVFNLDSINYDLENERFDIKLNKDSIYIISPDDRNIKKVEVDNVLYKSVFKPYYNKTIHRNSFYEVLTENDTYSLLSNYKLKIKGGSIDPLTKTYITPKEYFSEKDYFILKHKEESEMVPIKLKKSEILKLIDVPYVDEIKDFIKKQRLKYDQISDVSRILNYYYSIKS